MEMNWFLNSLKPIVIVEVKELIDKIKEYKNKLSKIKNLEF
jgi:uncharacterized protein YlzI (FlbEa/FlbD family)